MEWERHSRTAFLFFPFLSSSSLSFPSFYFCHNVKGDTAITRRSKNNPQQTCNWRYFFKVTTIVILWTDSFRFHLVLLRVLEMHRTRTPNDLKGITCRVLLYKELAGEGHVHPGYGDTAPLTCLWGVFSSFFKYPQDLHLVGRKASNLLSAIHKYAVKVYAPWRIRLCSWFYSRLSRRGKLFSKWNSPKVLH